jgi:hypothetical protein
MNITEKIRHHFGIAGRGTQMLHVLSQSKDPRDVSKSLADLEIVAKLYWPEESRPGEGDVIKKAYEIAQHNEEVNGHLPELILSHDFGEYSTKSIRVAFGIQSKGHRRMRLMLFVRLYPITDLIGEPFWRAFWECFRCKSSLTLCSHMLKLAVLGHYHLWVGGVEHNDISVKNLMYDKHNEDRGILNDYDLAHLRGQPRPKGNERTGTMPFMALDLLTDLTWKGKVKRIYRHDCESFAWVLFWICCRYDNGEEISNPPLNQLITHDYEQCFERKYTIFAKLPALVPTKSYKQFWVAAKHLLNVHLKLRTEYDQSLVNPFCVDGHERPAEDTMEQLWHRCRSALVNANFLEVL